MAWAKNGTPDTLSGTADEISISDLTAKKFNVFMYHKINSGEASDTIRYNGDTTSVYASRRSFDGAADSTDTSANRLSYGSDDTYPAFGIQYFINISGEEKLDIYFGVNQQAAGAANAPKRAEAVGKYVPSPDADITDVAVDNLAAGDYAAGSQGSALGTEGDEVTWDRTLEQSGTEFIATDTGNSLLHDGNDFTIGAWKELGRAKLGAVSDDIAVSNLPDKRYYMVLTNRASASNVDGTLRLNEDTGSNYARRWSNDGGTDNTTTSTTEMTFGIRNEATAVPSFDVGFLANLQNKEKLSISQGVHAGASGAGTAPNRREASSKWANTTDSINAITLHNIHTGDYAVDSEVVVLGYDPDDIHSKGFWEELASKDITSGTTAFSVEFPAKKYLWVQSYIIPSTTMSVEITANDDTSGNYSQRRSNDGAADVTFINQNILDPTQGSQTTPNFCNLFIINNQSEEKLFIGNTVEQNTAGETNPPKRREWVGKWNITTEAITKLTVTASANEFSNGSFIRVWGHD